LHLQAMRGMRDEGAESWVGEGFGRRRPRRTYAFEADAEGRVAYSIAAPGRSVSIEGSSCVIRGPRGTVEVGGVG